MAEQRDDLADSLANLAGNAADNVTDDLDPSADAGGIDLRTGEIDRLTQQVADLESRLLRMAADYQNQVRRSNQTVAATRDQTVLDIAKGFVGVLDHFDLALQIDPEKMTARALLQGVQLVRDEFLKTLEKLGVQRIDVQPNDVFDPNRHAAMLNEAVQGVETGHVARQLQPGYIIGDRTIRPAGVSVAP